MRGNWGTHAQARACRFHDRRESCRQKSGTNRESHGESETLCARAGTCSWEMIPRAELWAFICLSTIQCRANLPYASELYSTPSSIVTQNNRRRRWHHRSHAPRPPGRPTPNSEVAHKKLVGRTAAMHCGLQRVRPRFGRRSVGPANKCISHTMRGIPPRNVVVIRD